MNGLHTYKKRHNPHDPSERHGSIECDRRQPSCRLESAAYIVNCLDLSRMRNLTARVVMSAGSFASV